MDKRNCYVKGKLGVIINSYNHTYDVFICKTRRTMFGVSKKVVHILPKVETQKETRAKTQYVMPL
jgi:hypothetical protein